MTNDKCQRNARIQTPNESPPRLIRPFRFREFGFPSSLVIRHSDFTTSAEWVLGLRARAQPGSREKRWYIGHPFAVDHVRQISGDAFHDPVEERQALWCGGQGGLWIRLIGPDRAADIVRERGKRDGGFKFLRVAGQVLGEAVAA